MARYDDLVAEHEQDTDRKAAPFVAEAGALLDAWRRDLLALFVDRGLTATDRVTLALVAPLLPAVEALANTYRGRFDALLARAARTLSEVEVEHLAELLAEFEPAIGPDALAALRQLPAAVEADEALRAVVLFRSRRLWADATATVHAGLLGGLQDGRTGHRTAVDAAGVEVLKRLRARAGLVAEMEARRQSSETVTRAARNLHDLLQDTTGYRADPILRRIVEIRDRRNHPFSRAADGTTARPGDLFRVPLAAVEAQAAAMRKSGGGVFWRLSGADYVGDSLPAHYGDRGRITLDRASWHRRLP